MPYNKKTLISYFFLFLVAMTLVIPQIANADLLLSFVKGIDIMIVGITKMCSDITASLLKWIIMSDAINVAYTPHGASWTGNHNLMVDSGWAICRDLANMIVVLGFIIIGIATILRLQDYQAQKLLPKLIIVAILINFSPVICGVVIDASNITMNFFMKGDVREILPSWETQSRDIAKATNYTETITVSGSLILGNIVGFLVFGLLFVLFLARYIMLWILVIFSPIAFVCYVFPFTNQYFKQWWSQFIKWCLVGIPAAFTLYLASMSYSINKTSPSGDSTMAMLFTFSLPAMIMLVGFLYTLKFSGAGAAIAMGAAAATGGALTGAVAGAFTGTAKGKGILGKAGAGLGNLIGNSRAATASREAMGARWTAAKEKMGLASKGATAKYKENKKQDEKKYMQSLYAQGKKEQVARVANIGKGSRSAAALEVMAENNDLGSKNLNQAKIPTLMARAQAFGTQRKIFEKSDPNLAKNNTEEVNKIMKANPTYTQNQAENEAVNIAYQKLDVSDIRKLPKNALDINFIKNVSHKKINKASDEMSQGNVNQLKKYVTKGTKEKNELNSLVSAAAKGSKERAELIKKYLTIKEL
ncbi:type IV secretion system protein [Patescibacteria group bacterium]|nr:type IV secretion system protein [Patescibacteria group bacterium]